MNENILVVTDAWLDDNLNNYLATRRKGEPYMPNMMSYEAKPKKEKTKRRVIAKKIDIDLIGAKTMKALHNVKGFKTRTATSFI